jgi:hypothetical protein
MGPLEIAELASTSTCRCPVLDSSTPAGTRRIPTRFASSVNGEETVAPSCGLTMSNLAPAAASGAAAMGNEFRGIPGIGAGGGLTGGVRFGSCSGSDSCPDEAGRAIGSTPKRPSIHTAQTSQASNRTRPIIRMRFICRDPCRSKMFAEVAIASWVETIHDVNAGAKHSKGTLPYQRLGRCRCGRRPDRVCGRPDQRRPVNPVQTCCCSSGTPHAS